MNQLNSNELEVITILDNTEQGELVTVTNLSKETGIKPTIISHILLKLERNGFIAKVTPLKYRKEIPFIVT